MRAMTSEPDRVPMRIVTKGVYQAGSKRIRNDVPGNSRNVLFTANAVVVISALPYGTLPTQALINPQRGKRFHQIHHSRHRQFRVLHHQYLRA